MQFSGEEVMLGPEGIMHDRWQARGEREGGESGLNMANWECDSGESP